MKTSSLVSLVNGYLKVNNIPLSAKSIKGIIIVDNINSNLLCDCRELCEAATGLKFEAIGLSCAKVYIQVFTQQEIVEASLKIRLNNEISIFGEDLTYAANWCFRYICKFSDLSTRDMRQVWSSAYFHYSNNSRYFQTDTLPE